MADTGGTKKKKKLCLISDKNERVKVDLISIFFYGHISILHLPEVIRFKLNL